MTYPFVQSHTDLGRRRGPILALVIHMAEGGNTVGYLAKANPNGVSVHYVIEYSGRIVQMLREDHMHSSIRTSDIRTSDDGDGFYGATAAGAVLGDWAKTAKTLGPNHATLAVEIEGFAVSGPNEKQRIALERLVADLRTRYPSLGLLGHRDFTIRKACPGRLIRWDRLGGHGATEDALVTVTIDRYPVPRAATGTDVTGYLPDGRTLTADFSGLVSGSATITRDDGKSPKGAGWLVGASRPFTGYYLPAASLDVAPAPPDPAVKAAVNAALDHVAAPAAAVDAAIAEARIR